MYKLFLILFLAVLSSCTEMKDDELALPNGNTVSTFKLASVSGSAQNSITDLNVYVFKNDIYIKSFKDIKPGTNGDFHLLLPENASLYFTANIKEPASFANLQGGVSKLQNFLEAAITTYTTHPGESAPEFMTCVLTASGSSSPGSNARVIKLERSVARLDFDMSSDELIKVTRITVSNTTVNSSLFKGSTNPSSMGSIVYEKTYSTPIRGRQEDLFRIYENTGEINITITGTYNGASIVKSTKLSNIKRNTTYKINITHSNPASRYFIVAVGGQSNAAGWDFIPAENPEDEAPDPRIFQLSYRLGPKGHENLSIIPMQSYCDDVAPNETARGARGIHLPLGKELLKVLPAGYKVLFVPVAAGGATFSRGDNGIYQSNTMSVTNTNIYLNYKNGSALQRTLIDRLRYALNLDPNNKFGGIVWCQGEWDRAKADLHYREFTAMADVVNETLTNEGFGTRTPFGVVDKRSWYCFSCTRVWMTWNVETDAIAPFENYKYWSPDTFIHVPITAPVNPDGIGSGNTHFGRGTYRIIIAPLVAQCMNENGALLNGVVSKNDRFINKSTPTDAQYIGGSLTDSDIQKDLVLHLPFKNSVNENLKGTANVSSTNLSLVSADGLTDINRTTRARKALQLKDTEGVISVSGLPESAKWSVSFMLKRTGDKTKSMQTLISGGTSTPFIGFRKYTEGHTVQGIAEFIVEPIYSIAPNRAKAAPGNYVFADNVRDLNGWIHYVATYDHTNKECVIYMNGQEVYRIVIANASMPNLSSFKIGHASSTLSGVHGQIVELMVWKDVIESPTVEKLFFYNYYGFTK